MVGRDGDGINERNVGRSVLREREKCVRGCFVKKKKFGWGEASIHKNKPPLSIFFKKKLFCPY